MKIMLFLNRKINDSIMIDDEVVVTVLEIRGKSVKLGIDYPKDKVRVLRKEVYTRIQEENRMAASQAGDILDAIHQMEDQSTDSK
jgi:carbon storage regulator